MAQRAQTPEQTNKQPKIQTALFTCTANVLGFPRHSRCEVFSTYCEVAVQCKLCHCQHTVGSYHETEMLLLTKSAFCPIEL